jgi:MbtH protein
MSDARDETTIYLVIVSNEGQHSIWPAEKTLPPGWSDAGRRGTRKEVLEDIRRRPTRPRPKARYSRQIDYLIASIFYLGTQSYWWARTPRKMARELSLHEHRLKLVFEAFPGIFRRSLEPDDDTGQLMYCLQARYAHKDHGTQPDARISYIEPLSTDKLRLLQEFVLKSAEDERAGKRAIIGYSIAVTAAIISAIAALYAALLNEGGDASTRRANRPTAAATQVQTSSQNRVELLRAP